MSKPLLVGITGGIGSGKSTVCKIFEVLGCKTYYADDRAKALMQEDPELRAAIVTLFGASAYVDGKLDRAFIANKVFKDRALLDQLNGKVHPAVGRDVERWIDDNQEEKILLKEAALLFETGSYKELDRNVLVTAPEDLRIRRVLERDVHRDEKGIKDIIQKQLTDEEKKPLADFVIINDEQSSLIEQVMTIHGQLT